MTPDEFDAYLAVAKKHGVSRFRIGDVEAVLGGTLQDLLAVPTGPPEPRVEWPAPKTPEEHWDRVEEGLFPDGAPA